RLGDGALLRRRLDVYTTLDPSMQHAAERGVADALAALEAGHRWLRDRKTELEGAFVVLDPDDGAVRALVGGRDFARSPFDRAAGSSVFPRGGSTVAPTLVRGVRGADGSVLVHSTVTQTPAADARATYLVHHLLEGVVDRGTARGLRDRGFRGPLAGKTGTT